MRRKKKKKTEWRQTEYEFNKAMTNSGKTMVNIIQ